MDLEFLSILRCPVAGSALTLDGDALVSAEGRRYPVIDGIPCLMPPDAAPTHSGYTHLVEQNRADARRQLSESEVEAYIDGILVATCGNLFHGVKLDGDYPIPDFPASLPPAVTLDIGCNWGRWTIAGAMAGHQMVGIDVHLESLMVARRLAARLCPHTPPWFVLADARYAPFADEAFHGAFSYSVVQHFSRENAKRILGEVGRVLKPGGVAVVQMPNRDGLKTVLTMPRRRLLEGSEFDVRYYSVEALREMFQSTIGTANWSVDCFLGLNVHRSDRARVAPGRRWVVDLAEFLRRVSARVPPARRLADSVWVTAVKA